ncbi:hypothetical protein F4818DRAFT_429067 [Hypoxylon cercidicola]|nr:hypothetical protein F4818DRAFT_429067 [Hypoxylon cercidicola]
MEFLGLNRAYVLTICKTMWVVITQMEVPLPPQPQVPPGLWIPQLPPGMSIDQYLEQYDRSESIRTGTPQRSKISYCPWLYTDGGPNGFFNYVDMDLRRTIFECMYYRPEDRPTVERLLHQARFGASKTFPNETDDDIRQWVNQFIYSAPTA